jgi:hypothetical protein
MTFSFWVKRGNVNAAGSYQVVFSGTGNYTAMLYFDYTTKGTFEVNVGNNSNTQYNFVSSRIFVDTAAWYHIVVVIDTNNATAANRCLLYVNGEAATWGTAPTIPLGFVPGFNTAAAKAIGRNNNASSYYFDGYLTSFYLIDGQALTPSSFGLTDSTTGVWSPKTYSGTYGNNGFYLPFNDVSIGGLTATTGPGFSTYYAGTFSTSKYVTWSGTTIGTNSYTFECWFRTSTFSTPSGVQVLLGTTNSNALNIRINNSTTIAIDQYNSSQQTFTVPTISTNTWYHLAVVRSGTTTTVFLNGTRSSTGTVSMSNNYAAKSNVLGTLNTTDNYPLYGEMSNVRFVLGSAVYSPSSTTITVPTSALTAVTNTDLLTFQNSTLIDNSTNAFTLTYVGAEALAPDNSGNSNNWTMNNISLTSGVTYDKMIDSPTVYDDGSTGRGNYATLIPSYTPTDSSASLSYGNLRITGTTSYVLSSIAIPTSGKWYCEMTAISVSYGFGFAFGIRSLDLSINDVYVVMRAASNNYSINKGTATLASWSNIPAGAVLGCAFDNDAGTMNIYSNNVLIFTVTGIPNVASSTSNWHFHVAGDSISDVNDMNFGQRPFTYSPPSGYKALNTYNLPTPTILKGNQYMDATTYTGNNSTNVITNSGSMQPDMVWIKSRSSVTNHMLNDSVRGAGKDIFPNLSSAESTTNILTSFNSTGFTLSADGGGAGNGNGLTYVGWQWKKGATPGFDIVTYTGTGSARTISHSLGAVPALMLVKQRSSGADWIVYHKNLTSASYYLALDLQISQASDTTVWNNTAPTSSVFSLGTNTAVNKNGQTYIAYIWAEVPGFSKFGTYTGNGDADGPLVNCGFRPKFLITKNISSTSDWGLKDSARSPYNVMSESLYPNLSNAENGGTVNTDFYSYGFKPKNSGTGMNSSATFVYMAFAENPFKYARAR